MTEASFGKQACNETWVLLVTEYARRDLTMEGDRLNALMGIQAVFQ